MRRARIFVVTLWECRRRTHEIPEVRSGRDGDGLGLAGVTQGATSTARELVDLEGLARIGTDPALQGRPASQAHRRHPAPPGQRQGGGRGRGRARGGPLVDEKAKAAYLENLRKKFGPK